MKIGTILLSQDGKYIDDRGNLPYRTLYDKEWLTKLVSLNTISKKGYDLLPPSMQEVATLHHSNPTLALTIPELDTLPDILFVVRSARMASGGKIFKLDKYKPIVMEQRLEIWSRK